MKRRSRKCLGIRARHALTITAVCAVASFKAQAQAANGSLGIQNATKAVGGYFGVGCTLMYVIGAIVGLTGAIKVYQKWSHGDHDTSKVAVQWFGACIFLVVVAVILEGFFGVTQ